MKARIRRIAAVLQTRPDWDTLSAAEIVAAGNEMVTVRRGVPLNDLLAYILLSSRWRELRKLSETSGDGGKLAEAVIEMFRNPRLSSLNVDGPMEQQMLSGLVAYGVIDEGHVDDILSMGDALITRWEEAGISLPVEVREVYDARKLLVDEWNKGAKV